MGNIITIKHGTSEPKDNQLAYFELGYSTDEKIMYINDEGTITPIGSNYILKEVANISDANKPGVVYIVPSIGDTQSQTYNVSSVAPNDTSKLWIDTSSNYPLLKFYDTSSGTWRNIASIWS